MSSIVSFVSRLWRMKLAAQRVVMVCASAIFTLLIFVSVLGRYLFGFNIFGVEEVATYAAVWLYFMGAAHGAHMRGHITAGLMYVVLPRGRARQGARVLAGMITTVLAGWMTTWAWGYFLWSYERGARSLELGVPMAWIHLAMPLGLALMTLYFLVECMEDVRLLARGEERRDEAAAGKAVP